MVLSLGLARRTGEELLDTAAEFASLYEGPGLAAIMSRPKRAYAQIDGVVFLHHQPTQEKIDETFSGLPAVFGVTIYGTDLDTLTALAGQAEQILARDPAVANVVNSTKVKAPELRAG